MVQAGFYGELKGSMPLKQEGYFEQGDRFGGGVGFGFKEGGFNQDPMRGDFDNFVKVEMDEDVCEDRSSSSYKRAKYQQELSSVSSTTFSQRLPFNPLEEPSPLGLTLKKTPSFLNLIETKLSQGDWTVPSSAYNENPEIGTKKDAKSVIGQSANDKLKASNFPASLLRIGSWERVSRYENNLVAKCYYAKRKLVWEVLEGGLKSKIEIQWSDITSLKATCPDNEPGTLEIDVSRPPLFCRETNPQPRKHTLWQPTSDFTGGQASICRRHFLQFNPGILERHFEKLIQCDHRLNMLSKEGIMSENLPYFSSSAALFQVQDDQNCYGAVQEHKSHLIRHFNHFKDSYLSPFSTLSDTGTPLVSMLVPKIESVKSDNRVVETIPQETPSPSSVMDLRTIEESGTSDSDELNVNNNAEWKQMRFTTAISGLQNQRPDSFSSKSMSTLANRGGSFFPEQKVSQNLPPVIEANKKILHDIAQHLLSDSLLPVASDEQKVMARVNSMASLIQQDISAAHRVPINARSLEISKVEDNGDIYSRNDDMTTAILNGACRIGSHKSPVEGGHMHCQQSTGMPRQESLGDLIVNIPRIPSFSQLFVDYPNELMIRSEQGGEIGWNRLR